MSISVIVATYNRASLLEECLVQLARQRFEAGDEVVVVDNGSTDGTANVLLAAAARFPAPLRAVTEARPGKSRAVATAIAASRGEILAFTDDDVLVADDWLTVARALFRESEVGLAGGPVRPRWSCSPPVWLRPRVADDYGLLGAPLALLDYGPRSVPLGRRTALGANMAVLRRALEEAGGFPTDLGKLRGTLLSGEDRELCARVQAAGFLAVYDPRLVVRHHVPADRLRLRYHVRWFFWSGITNAVLESRQTQPARRDTAPAGTRYWWARIARGAARGLAGAAMLRPRMAAEAVADVAFSLGYLACSRGWTHTGLEPLRGAGRRAEAL